MIITDSSGMQHFSKIVLWNFETDTTLDIDFPSENDAGFQKVYKNLNSSRLSITCLKLTKLIIVRHAYTGAGRFQTNSSTGLKIQSPDLYKVDTALGNNENNCFMFDISRRDHIGFG